MKCVPAPTHLFLEITTECQLRCQQCHYWTTKERLGVLSLEEKRGLLEQFIQINPSGVVIFTGGEPLLRLNHVLELSRQCRKAGLLSVVSTNAATISPEVAEALIKDGPSYIAVSIDSHLDKLHDQIRGVPGTFQKAVAAIREMLRQKVAQRSSSRIFISSILCELNIADCLQLAKFAKTLGVDGVTYQVLEPTFALATERDAFYERHWFKNVVEAQKQIEQLATLYAGDPFLLLNEQDLEWLKALIAHSDLLPEPVCDSSERNLWVDSYGETRLCAYMEKVTTPPSLGNIRQHTLASMWSGRIADSARPLMAKCRQTCGMLNCHRRRTM